MGTYVYFEAKPGQENWLNARYAELVNNPEAFIVYSKSVIEAEIAYIHSPNGESQAHLREQIKTVEDWNRVLPVCREHIGQIKISGCSDSEIHPIQERLQFIMDNQDRFSKIDGMEDAASLGFNILPANRHLKPMIPPIPCPGMLAW